MLCYEHVYAHVSRQDYDDTLLTILVHPLIVQFQDYVMNMLLT